MMLIKIEKEREREREREREKERNRGTYNQYRSKAWVDWHCQRIDLNEGEYPMKRTKYLKQKYIELRNAA